VILVGDIEIIRGIRETTIARMKSLGVYREEYDGTIEIYSQLCEQYQTITERFEKSGYKVQTKSAQGGMKKSPIVATLESLRKDILSYSDRLCLNPKSFDSLGQTAKPAPRSKLEEALEAVRDG